MMTITKMLEVLLDKSYRLVRPHKESLNRSAGVLILSAVAMSVNIGIFPSIMLGLAGLLMTIAASVEDYSFENVVKSISTAIVLASPSASAFFGREYKNSMLFIAATLILASVMHKEGGK